LNAADVEFNKPTRRIISYAGKYITVIISIRNFIVNKLHNIDNSSVLTIRMALVRLLAILNNTGG